MNSVEQPLDMFAAEDLLVEDLPDTGALATWASLGTFGSSVGSCASCVGTASSFS